MIHLLLDATTQTVDLERSGGALFDDDDTLYTAVLISLFTRQLADEDDMLPEPRGNRQGWWADPYADAADYKIGSKLWLLARSKTTQAVMNQARIYALEALQWLIDDKVAETVDVEVERQGSMLAFRVEITKPEKPAARWVEVWETHLSEL